MSLTPGKLPNEQLARLLATVPHADPRVLVGPDVGRDAAVIDIGGGRVLVAKMDPVTFAAHDIGWYAVHVNANDIACMGGHPAWFMATALLPPGGDDSLPETIFRQLSSACAKLGIELVGGHTEVTIGLDRPIIVGAMLGEAEHDEIIRGEDITAGDRVLLAKGVAIEGTALLAREAGDELARRGVAGVTLERAREMLFDPGISIVADARALRDITRPRLMHDPTEGGIATALAEMANAAAATLRIDAAAIDVYPETRQICDALALDPLGLLASGALLAIVSEAGARAMESTGNALPGRWKTIGVVESGPPRVIMGHGDSATPFPEFRRDELARFLETAEGEGQR
jgi:hydrogenase maturation factor